MRHEIFKFLHVMGAVAWVGSGVGLSVLGWRMRRSDDLKGLVTVYGRADELGKVLFGPAVLITLAFGIAMVATTPAIAFGDLWILIGFGGIVLSGVAENAIAGPANKRFQAAMATGDADAASRHSGRALVGSYLDVTVLVVVVWAMVARPML